MFSITSALAQIRRFITRFDLLIAFGITSVYLTTRLYNILALPIFSDEGIYIHWAMTAASDPAWRFISLIDGKQPLQTWGTIPFIKLFPSDYLFGGRLFAVTTGFVALLGMQSLCAYLWGRKGYLIGSLLYIFTPYFLFYDRLALVDSAVNAAAIWIFFFSILLVRTRRLDIALMFGVVAGTGLLAKSSVLMFVVLASLAPLMLLNLQRYTHFFIELRKQKKQIVDYVLLFVLAFGIGVVMYLTQKFFSPFFHYIAAKNLTFVLSPSEWLTNPFQLWANNLVLVPTYVMWESGWIPSVLGVLGIAQLIRKRDPLGYYLLAWIIFPFLFTVSFNKVLYPRYLVFFAGIMTIGAVSFLTHLGTRYRTKILITVFTFLIAVCSPQWFSAAHISLPEIDKGQYIVGGTAVWGAEELVNVVRQQTADGRKAIVLAEGNFGLIADVLEVFKKTR
jgi:4-amino-4-deoxy-L-arabinose transferase-like glycosyltransferase